MPGDCGRLGPPRGFFSTGRNRGWKLGQPVHLAWGRQRSSNLPSTSGSRSQSKNLPASNHVNLTARTLPAADRRVQLMATCLCDAFFDDAAVATVQILEHLG